MPLPDGASQCVCVVLPFLAGVCQCTVHEHPRATSIPLPLSCLTLMDVAEPAQMSHARERAFWKQHGSLANLLNLELPERITIHIPLNIVFVGFRGALEQQRAAFWHVLTDYG